MSYVPVVDLSRDPAALAHELDEIGREVGFFQIVEHGASAECEYAPVIAGPHLREKFRRSMQPA